MYSFSVIFSVTSSSCSSLYLNSLISWRVAVCKEWGRTFVTQAVKESLRATKWASNAKSEWENHIKSELITKECRRGINWQTRRSKTEAVVKRKSKERKTSLWITRMMCVPQEKKMHWLLFPSLHHLRGIFPSVCLVIKTAFISGSKMIQLMYNNLLNFSIFSYILFLLHQSQLLLLSFLFSRFYSLSALILFPTRIIVASCLLLWLWTRLE